MNDNLSKYLCFSLGHEHYAMPLLTVREVIGVPQATPMPFMPAHFLGIFNFNCLCWFG
jgi:purine-binding chemotaxis protein CheW